METSWLFGHYFSFMLLFVVFSVGLLIGYAYGHADGRRNVGGEV